MTIKGELPTCGTSGTLAIEVQMRKGPLAFVSNELGKRLALHGRVAGPEVECQPVWGKELAGVGCWQAWRIPVAASSKSRPFEFFLESRFEKDVTLNTAGHFIPA
jgi:hypothetical protein